MICEGCGRFQCQCDLDEVDARQAEAEEADARREADEYWLDVYFDDLTR